MKEEWNVKCEFAEWSCSLWHIPSGLAVDWWNACQEPLTLNTELDLTDKISCCCWPLVLLTGSQYMISHSEHLQLHKKASGSDCVVGCCCGRWCVCYYYLWYLSQKGRCSCPQQGRFVWPSSPSIHAGTLTEAASASWAALSHDVLHDPPGGVCPFGKWVVVDGVESRGPIKTAGFKGAVKELCGFSFKLQICRLNMTVRLLSWTDLTP